MPSVKLPKKSTDTDMTPFVDIAFLILTFFIMATKMKAPEPVEAEPPSSVATKTIPANDAILFTMDAENKVYFSIQSEKDKTPFERVINALDEARGLNLSASEKESFKSAPIIGVPLNQLKQYLAMPRNDQASVKLPGIPYKDSLTNELVWWVAAAKKAYAGQKMKFLIKGDSKANYPTFEAIIDALKRNEEFKYFLVTSMEEAPVGSDLSRLRSEQ